MQLCHDRYIPVLLESKLLEHVIKTGCKTDHVIRRPADACIHVFFYMQLQCAVLQCTPRQPVPGMHTDS